MMLMVATLYFIPSLLFFLVSPYFPGRSRSELITVHIQVSPGPCDDANLPLIWGIPHPPGAPQRFGVHFALLIPLCHQWQPSRIAGF